MSLDLYINCRCCNSSLFDRNITHNVSPMWKLAGVWEALYESDGIRCGDYLAVLEKGLDDMRLRPGEYRKLNPSNGWGSCESALNFLESVVEAVKKNPDMVFRVSA